MTLAVSAEAGGGGPSLLLGLGVLILWRIWAAR